MFLMQREGHSWYPVLTKAALMLSLKQSANALQSVLAMFAREGC